MVSLNEIDDEDLKAFLVESHELLNHFEQNILYLENNSVDSDRLNQLYRALHTIKGNCGFLPFSKLEAIAHAGETLLDKIRTAQNDLTPEIIAVLFRLIDTIRRILQTIESTGNEGNADHTNLIATLIALSSQGQNDILENQPIEIYNDSGGQSLSPTDSTIRVQVDLLDHVMNLVGELVLARNRVLQLSTVNSDSALLSICQQINLITNELQDGVMRTRLQPISTLWRNLPRVVRDLAIATGKDVSLELEGSETELDRSIVAAIKDPLMHLVRNCIDHGIETSDIRVANGKPAQGTLKLSAYQESGKVVLEVSDDGSGINPAQLKTQSQHLNPIGPAQADLMTDKEALELIFLPGFSTATEVTRLSGRGVGMDVVRRNLEAVNGTIEVDSQLGHGTTFRLKIPLTLAIIPALLVSSGGQRFTIPQSSVQELVRIEGAETIDLSIETLLNVPVYRLRGQILPIINLSSVLHLSPPTKTDLLYFVVLAVDSYRFGLIVDEIEDTQDIVVKPLSKQLKSLEMYAGATVLGDGNASLILDIAGLAQYANVQQQSQIASVSTETEQINRQLILIVLSAQGSRMGILLTKATRLEILPISAIEQVGDRFLMQYRDLIVSLIDLQSFFTGVSRSLMDKETISIVVVTLDEHRTVGLVVDRILDIVEESLTVKGAANHPGVQCYATVQGQITEILDIDAIVELASSPLFDGRTQNLIG
jgi:two-component system, chemotaxis family, sensor kinase CheA